VRAATLRTPAPVATAGGCAETLGYCWRIGPGFAARGGPPRREVPRVDASEPVPARPRVHRRGCPGGVPQREPLPPAARRAGRSVRGRRLRRALPGPGAPRAPAVAARARDGAAVLGAPLRPAGRRGRALADRLEVRARPGAERPGLRLQRAQRVPRALGGGEAGAAAPGPYARALHGARPTQDARPAAHRQHARARGGARDEPAGARGRDAPRDVERGRGGRARLAQGRGAGGLVRWA